MPRFSGMSLGDLMKVALIYDDDLVDDEDDEAGHDDVITEWNDDEKITRLYHEMMM